MKPSRTTTSPVRRALMLLLLVGSLAALFPASAASARPDAGVWLGAGDRPHASASNAAVAWQRIALRTVFTEGAKPPQTGTLYLAFTSLAMHDAAKKAVRRGTASPTAAVAVAAHDVLTEYFPSSQARLSADLSATLAGVPDGRAETRGVGIGRAAAARVIARRQADGRDDPNVVYQKTSARGVWQPAPGASMATPWLGFVEPVVLCNPVAVDGPDALTSTAYAADYDEVKRYGSVGSTERTEKQTKTAQFFAFNPVVMYRDALLRRLEKSPLSLLDTTRLFARIDGSVADAMILTFRLKIDVGFWRPLQAIAAGDQDGNPRTTAEPGWTPLVTNPAYPDYTSGHAAVTAPFAAVLRHTLGDDTSLDLVNPTLGVTRTYTSLRALEHDALHARIWGGMHFRDAMEDGYRLGHQTARRVIRLVR